jgi:hypothetical protein
MQIEVRAALIELVDRFDTLADEREQAQTPSQIRRPGIVPLTMLVVLAGVALLACSPPCSIGSGRSR